MEEKLNIRFFYTKSSSMLIISFHLYLHISLCLVNEARDTFKMPAFPTSPKIFRSLRIKELYILLTMFPSSKYSKSNYKDLDVKYF